MLQRKKPKEITALVVSDKMNKTRVVQIVTLAKHPKYSKVMKRTKKFKVHDEKNESKTGDRVRITQTRPLSKDKNWRLVEVVK